MFSINCYCVLLACSSVDNVLFSGQDGGEIVDGSGDDFIALVVTILFLLMFNDFLIGGRCKL